MLGRKRGPAEPGEQFQQEWKKMEDSFGRLIDFVESGCTIRGPDWIRQNMEAYACVYNLCTKNEGNRASATSPAQMLYTRTKAMIEKYLSDRVTQQVAGKTGEDLLQRTYKHWEAHQLVVKWGRFMFRYLDDYYTKQQNIDNLRIMMLKCFNTAVFEKIKADLCSVLLSEVQKERDNIEINRAVMQEAIGLFVEMGMDSLVTFEKDFEAHFLKKTAEFYRRSAVCWMDEQGGNFNYLKRVEKALTDEHNRARNYLHGSSVSKVVGCVEQELLVSHHTRVLEDGDAGTEALLNEFKTEDLGRMYSLFKRIPSGLDPMANILRDFIKNEGKQLNKKFCGGDLDGNAYIDACLDLHDKYTQLFLKFFENAPIFHKARKEAYEVFMNDTLQPTKEGQGKITIPELLSTYCDNVMKNEKITPDELEDRLDKIVSIFSYVSDKDLFQEFYRKQMSKRLLISKTDNENERQLIAKLKMKMGAPYTSKLEGMIVDKGLSAETQKAFLDFCKNKSMELKIDFSAQVLTMGFWPAFKIEVFNMPEELSYHIGLFKLFYDKTTQSRLLKWVHSLGMATVAARFNKGPKEMLVSTYQACVLLMFNNRDTVVASDMIQELGLPMDEIRRTVHSLTFGKFPVLSKIHAEEKKTKTINEPDQFQVNVDFACPQRKFKIPNVIKTVGDPIEKTDENRRHVIEACLVRIMKSRKQLGHTELVGECIRQLSHYFKPDPKVIKKRIEDLITRQYLERSEEDRNLYRYLA